MTWRYCFRNSIPHKIFDASIFEMYICDLEHLFLPPEPHMYFVGMERCPLPFLTSIRQLHGRSLVQGVQLFMKEILYITERHLSG